MTDPLFVQLLAGLFLWSLLSLAAGFAGAQLTRNEFWRAIWRMTGLWGFIDGLIAWYGLVTGPLPAIDLGPVLQFHAALDGLYLAAGAILITRLSAHVRGFGVAVAAQGLFLLAFDVYFWRQCEAMIGDVTAG